MRPEEKRRLPIKYRLKENQLMRIQAGDTVARYYGLEPGQVVKTIQASYTFHIGLLFEQKLFVLVFVFN
jgi:DNA-directed RNA polymerase I, II, and III subunit RPABC1